ncbi:bile acid:sodium symporter family protein [Natrinema salifodinae]|uniref:Solute carrier family 10 (Sodium/bile acid cotransporter), member 7 n=1 Tax=Natrinema salifodinae TaxID=1202768 RepID=A0A1I0LYG1_9EURY|nr:bile acid:sodium symporter [Natrinema salifodinae]SEV79841.1 solute carrier family 10 (sodium/bile acid cotransporter), member 7 [Natrinema salifodinae]
MNHFRTLVRSQRSLFVVLAATLAGVAYPAFSAPLQPILPILVAGLVFTAFYGFSFADLSVRALSIPIIASLGCLYLLVPIALYPIAALVLSGDVLLGVLIVLSAPLAAGSSIIWTRLSGGNALLATVIVLASMLLAPLAMPTTIALFADSPVDLSAAEMIVELGTIILGAGVLARLVPNGTVSDGQLDGFSVATLGIVIYVGVGDSTLSVDVFQLAIVCGIAIAALCLSAGIAYALYARGLRSDECLSVLFSSSMKNLSVSVMVGAVFGGGAIIASITAFHVAQQIVSSSLVRHLDSTATSSATSAQSSEPVSANQLGD